MIRSYSCVQESGAARAMLIVSPGGPADIYPCLSVITDGCSEYVDANRIDHPLVNVKVPEFGPRESAKADWWLKTYIKAAGPALERIFADNKAAGAPGLVKPG